MKAYIVVNRNNLQVGSPFPSRGSAQNRANILNGLIEKTFKVVEISLN